MKKYKNSKNLRPIINQKLWNKLFVMIPMLVLFLYTPIIVKQEFINYDDDWTIYENPFITNFSGDQTGGLFHSFYYGQYSPLAMTVLGSLYSISDGKPGILKFGALFIHLINIILVYSLFRAVFKDNRLAFLTSALFAVHPVQIESIAWLSAVYKIGLYSLFTLGGLIFWIKFQEKEKRIFYVLSLLMMVLSCFSKEQAVVFPLFLILLIYTNNKPIFTKETLLKLSPFLLISIVFVIVTFLAVKSYNEVQVINYSLPQRIYFLTFTFVSYFRLYFFPLKLSAFYLFPDVTIGQTGYFIFPFLSMILLGLIYFRAKKDRQVLMGVMFFAVSILLTFALQLLSVRDTLYADRYLYLGISGLAFATIAGIENVTKKSLTIIWGAIVLIFIVLSIQRLRVFQNSETLWTDAINKNPKNAFAYNNRGNYLRQNGQFEKAITDYNKALNVNPKYYFSLNNRGKVYLDLGKIDLALEDFNKALIIEPGYVKALSNRGAAYGLKQDWDKSLADLNLALEIKPDFANALSNRGLVYFQMSEYQKCIDDYVKYLKIVPNDAYIINTIALCYSRLKNYYKAIEEYNKSINIKPNQGAFYMNRSYNYNLMGDKQNALKDALQAKKLGSKVDQNYLKLLQQ